MLDKPQVLGESGRIVYSLVMGIDNRVLDKSDVTVLSYCRHLQMYLQSDLTNLHTSILNEIVDKVRELYK